AAAKVPLRTRGQARGRLAPMGSTATLAAAEWARLVAPRRLPIARPRRGRSPREPRAAEPRARRYPGRTRASVPRPLSRPAAPWLIRSPLIRWGTDPPAGAFL